MRNKLLWVSAILVVIFVTALMAAPQLVEGRYNKVRSSPPYHTSSKLHQKLFVADLHADSLLWGRNLLKRSATGHVDLPRLQQANVSLQAFTVVTTAPRKLNVNQNNPDTDLVRTLAIAERWPKNTWNSPKQRALYQASRLREFGSKSNGSLVLLRTRVDLEQFVSSEKPHCVAALLGAEGAQPLEGNLANIDDLYSAGFRMMSPTHFTDTEVGGSASGEKKSGLSDFGKQWVHAMEAKHMLIDLAHASPATVRDITAVATRPLIVSHTGVKGTCNNNRNLSDDELRAVARTGGLIGIGYWETATCGRDAAAIVRAIRYTVSVVGADHVALGSDFDGSTTMPFDVTGLPLITEGLKNAGLSEHDIRLIMGGNVIRVLLQTLPE